MSESANPLPPPKDQHVRLILAETLDGHIVCMDVPIPRINANCIRPRAYLLFLASQCTGDESGFLAEEDTGPEYHDIGSNGEIENSKIYRYVVKGRLDPRGKAAVDLEAIRNKTSLATSTGTQESVKDELLQRDYCCVFTGTSPYLCVGQHLIPHAKGQEWFDIILENREKEVGEVLSTEAIDGPRNCVLVNSIMNILFAMSSIAYLKTPNKYLLMEDIPKLNRDLPGEVQYPKDCRYTLHWVIEGRRSDRIFAPQDADAAFSLTSTLKKPAALICHYTYAGHALEQWGVTNVRFQDNPNLVRPQHSTPSPLRPPQTKGNRASTVEKLDKARAKSGQDNEDGDEQIDEAEDDGELTDEFVDSWDVGDGWTLSKGELGPLGTGGRPHAYQLMALWSLNSEATRAKQEASRETIKSWAELVGG